MLAGFHEVIVTPGTTAAITRQRSAHKSLWRVSSTLFSHIQSDQELGPLGHFSTPQNLEKYTPLLTGDMVRRELQAISLDKSNQITPSKPGLSG